MFCLELTTLLRVSFLGPGTEILKFYTVITSTLDVFRGELSFPQDKPVEQWPEP